MLLRSEKLNSRLRTTKDREDTIADVVREYSDKFFCTKIT